MNYAMKTAKFQTMKTRISFVAMFFVAFLATSCNVERSEKYQALLAERDSLYTEAVAAKGGFDNALNTINEIENALDLEKQLVEQGSKSKALTQTVDRLKKQLEEKETFIISLRDELQQSREQIATLNEQVSDLTENIDNLNSSLDVMTVQNAAQQATIENQDAMLNAVWICIATQQVLVEKGVVSKGGLFQASEISKQGFDNSQFMQGNKRDLDVIPLHTKKAKIMTNHPESSYQLNEGEEGMLSIQILDKDAFWSISNYLVVSIK